MAEIVFLTSRFPFPLEKGDKHRAFNQIKMLSGANRVHLISLSETEPTPADRQSLEPFCTSIHNFHWPRRGRILRLPFGVLSGMPFQVAYFYKRNLFTQVKALIEEIKPDQVHCHLIRMAEYARAADCSRKSIDYMDCFSKGAEKEAAWSGNVLRRLFLRLERRLLLRYEARSFHWFQRHSTISEPDRRNMPVSHPEKIAVVPNGVDTGIFHPMEESKQYDLLFTGHMSYPPNIAAALYCAKEILPVVNAGGAGLSLLIAGVGATPEVKKLHGGAISVTAHFDHIRLAFARSRIMLAPMLISIGLQNKILQAMAMKIPVICTRAANEPIQAPQGCLLLADDPQAFAEQVRALLNNQELYESIAENAFQFVREKFSWDSAAAAFERSLLA